MSRRRALSPSGLALPLASMAGDTDWTRRSSGHVRCRPARLELRRWPLEQCQSQGSLPVVASRVLAPLPDASHSQPSLLATLVNPSRAVLLRETARSVSWNRTEPARACREPRMPSGAILPSQRCPCGSPPRPLALAGISAQGLASLLLSGRCESHINPVCLL